MQTLAPFGFRPAYHPTGLERGISYAVAAAYPVNMFKGDPVILNTNGTVTAGTAAADLLGVFNGVEFIDVTGKPTYSNFWPAGQTVFPGQVPTAYVWSDPNVVYDVQVNGSVAITAIGDQADMVVGAGSIQTGLSTAALNATLVGAAGQGQFRIIDINRDPANAVGDPFTVVQVQLARSQFVANKVAI